MSKPDRSSVPHDELERFAGILERSSDYQVLRRLVVPESYSPPSGAQTRVGLIVDVETTGLNTASDAIIEFGAVPFEFDSAGNVYRVLPAISGFEDPGRPLSAEVIEITGITDDDVRGQHLDDKAIMAAVDAAVLIIAHNAGFDRRMLERRFPMLASKHWACSQEEVPWVRFGSRGRKLEYLLYKLTHTFHTGHRAADDCLATLHLLASPRLDERTPLSFLLESARRPTMRLWATGTPIEVKDALKVRGYRWFPGDSERPRAWYRDVTGEDQLASEQEWLREHGYEGLANPNWRVERFTALERYSVRMG